MATERFTLTRLPGLLRGGDYNPDQWLDRPDILEQDVALMQKAGMNTATLGVFSWAAYERREGEYNFQWLLDTMDRLYKAGISTELATPSGAKPYWMAKKYPEILRVGRDGRREHQGNRENHCMSSPVYRQKVAEMDRRLAEAVKGHPGLVAWHISNEFNGACYCPLCTARFRDWLRERYHNDIEAVNHAWWTGFWSHTFTDFEEIEPPFDNGDGCLNGLLLDWQRFTSWNTTDFMNAEMDLVRQITPGIPVTTNLMEIFYELDYHALSEKLDFVSWDSYSPWGSDALSQAALAARTAFAHAVIRGCKRDKPWLLMESTPSLVNWQPINKLKRPGVNRMTQLQAVACGSDGAQYFQWRKGRSGAEQYHGAVVDHDGREDARVFQEVRTTNEALCRIAEVQGSVGKPQAALLFDWNNRWAIHDLSAMRLDDKRYEATCGAWYTAALRLGLDLDVVGVHEDLSRYKLVILPMLYLLKPGFAARLRSFVENGGVVLATYLLGYANESTLCWLGGFPGDGLREVFGVTARELDSLFPSDRNRADWCGPMKGQPAGEIVDYCELLELNDDATQVLAYYGADFYAGSPAVTVHPFGKGQAFYDAARMDDAGNTALLLKAMEAAGLVPMTLPEGVEYHCREAEGVRYHFYLNFGEAEATVTLPAGEDLLNGGEKAGPVTLPPLAAAVVRETV